MKRLLLPFLAALALPTAVDAKNAFSTVQCDNKNYSLGKLVNLIKSGTVTLKTINYYNGNETPSLGIIIGKNDKYTYIVSDSSAYKYSSPFSKVFWEDGTNDNAELVYSFTEERYGDPKENDLALFRYKGNKGSVVPLKENTSLMGTDIVSVISKDGYETFDLISGILEANKNYGKVLATDLEMKGLSSGSPLINNNGCLVGMYASNEFTISSKQIISMVKNYKIFKNKLDEILNQYPIKGDNYKWPSDWSKVNLEKERKSRIKPYATVNFAPSIKQACDVYKEAKQQESFYGDARDKMRKNTSNKFRNGEITKEERTTLMEPYVEKHWPWAYKLIAAKVDLLRLNGLENWQLYSRYSSEGVNDLFKNRYKKDTNSRDPISELIFDLYYWGNLYSEVSDAICKKYKL